jgi:hypothetical protein
MLTGNSHLVLRYRNCGAVPPHPFICLHYIVLRHKDNFFFTNNTHTDPVQYCFTECCFIIALLIFIFLIKWLNLS